MPANMEDIEGGDVLRGPQEKVVLLGEDGLIPPELYNEGTGGGVTDHGMLDALSLADDDHTHYALADGTRGNFATPASVTAVDNRVTAVDGELTTLENEVITARGVEVDLNGRLNTISTSVENLQTTKEDVGVASNAVANHRTEPNPHPGMTFYAIWNGTVWTFTDGTTFTPVAGRYITYIIYEGDPDPVVGTGSGNYTAGEAIWFDGRTVA